MSLSRTPEFDGVSMCWVDAASLLTCELWILHLQMSATSSSNEVFYLFFIFEKKKVSYLTKHMNKGVVNKQMKRFSS